MGCDDDDALLVNVHTITIITEFGKCISKSNISQVGHLLPLGFLHCKSLLVANKNTVF